MPFGKNAVLAAESHYVDVLTRIRSGIRMCTTFTVVQFGSEMDQGEFL